MTNREQLLQDGYLVFEQAVPEDLYRRAADIINATSPNPCFIWRDDVAAEFRSWGEAFLNSQDLSLSGWAADIHIFNRRPGTDPQFWHDDDSRNHPFYQSGPESYGRRVFCCTYFTHTFNGRAPLRVIPGSHHGGYKDLRVQFTTMRLITSAIDPTPPYANPIDYKGNPFVEYPDVWKAHPDERVLEVPAGTMVLCDERIMHGTLINMDTERRPMALWWLAKHPDDRNREAEFAARHEIKP